MKKILCAAFAVMWISSAAVADKPDDGLVFKTLAALKGKKVGFVPLSMGFDLTEAWASGLRKDAETYGYELMIRDPNWNADAGSQAVTQLIREKPDVLILHPPEMQIYSRLIQQAQRAGIPIVFVNLKASVNAEYYIGPDWYELLVQQTQAMRKLCGKQNGGTGKIAVMQGVLTSTASQYGIQAVKDVVAEADGDLEIVSNQAADWDASKAKSIATTVLQANPDLCGYVGMWDGMDVGIAAAIREAGKQNQVKIVTNGGGNQNSACNNLENGNFSVYVSFEANVQARDVMMVVRSLLQNPPAKAGANPVGLYTPLKTLHKDTLHPGSCWNPETLQAEGP